MKTAPRCQLSAVPPAFGRGVKCPINLGTLGKALGVLLAALLVPAAALAQGAAFDFQGNVFQSYTVPAEGWYFLDASGAQGGPASNDSHQGGKGARMQGYAFLSAGDELRIAVGGAGAKGQNDGNNVSGGGGGGGSSIVLVDGSTYVPLLMTGGGGGGAANYNGSSGLFTTEGGPPNYGANGGGGGIGADPYGGAGGAGYLTDGGTHFDRDNNTLLSFGGQAYLSGNYGGGSGQNGGGGGWGGGGSGGPAVDKLLKNKDGGGGGGGGYSGGGGGVNEGDGGGGGGSYVDANLDTTLCAAAQGYQVGHGLVEITPVIGPPVIEQPADQQVETGGSVTLGPVYDDPTGQTTYQWMKDGVLLAGQTNASLTIASFQFTDSGGYQAVAQRGLATFITLPTFLSSSSPQSTLQAWGYNGNGQLGLGDTTERTTPTQVTLNVASDVVAVSAGWYRSLFVKRDGTLWAMGDNNRGQLGLGDTTNRDTPTQVYFRDAANLPTTPMKVATLGRLSSSSSSSIAIAAPELGLPPFLGGSGEVITLSLLEGFDALNGVVGDAVDIKFFSKEFIAGAYTVSGNLPPGLRLSPIINELGVGTISGTPTQEGLFLVNLTGWENSNAQGPSSQPITLLFEINSEASRLVNQSLRANVSSGSGTLICGFVVRSGSPKTMLIRGVGPGLLDLGVTNPIADPVLTVFNEAGQPILTNDDWEDYNAIAIGDAGVDVGAFNLESGSLDAAILEDFDPGIYTVHVVSMDGSLGEALLEVYDVSGDMSLANQSSRSKRNESGEVSMAGFVIGGESSKTVLLRGVGPGIASFGLDDASPDVSIELFDEGGTSLAVNDDWNSNANANDIITVGDGVGAFPLEAGSKDAALLMTLDPGLYTLHLSGPNGSVGVSLIEVYEVLSAP